MADRLNELLRQRALLQQHVAWLDAEIAAAADPSGAAPAATPVTAPSTPPSPPANAPLAGPDPAHRPSAPPPPAAPAIGAVSPDAILEEYRSAPGTLQQDVRKGCFLYFAAALALLGLGVTVLYFAISSR
jgi:hypothetical protein